MVGPDGGTVTIYGVSLKLPPGAVLQKHQITLTISCEARHQPQLERNTALMSPVVSCEPHGLQFQKPVTLLMPHCACSFDNMTVLTSSTPLQAQTCWSEAEPEACTLSGVTKRDATLTFTHFSLYALVDCLCAGRVRAKVVRLVAFAPPLNSPDFFHLTVYCVNDYKDKVDSNGH